MREHDYFDVVRRRTCRVVSGTSLEALVTELEPLTPEYILFLAADSSKYSSAQLTTLAGTVLETGAGYVCCWGPDCERLHDAFDVARDARGARCDGVIMTTSHASEPLEKALWFADCAAVPGQQHEAASGSVLVAVVNNAEWLERVKTHLASDLPLPNHASGKPQNRNLWSAAWLAARSLLWTILFPGFFAGYVPWRYFGLSLVQVSRSGPGQVLGLLLAGAGVVLLAVCIVEFARSGRGTLSPVDPPRHLVVRGLYRYVRNPMYLSVTAIVLGEVLLTGSTALAVYWAIWFACVNAFVIGYEEPTLRRQFGASYDEYVRRVGRWIPSHVRQPQRHGEH